MKTQDHDSGFTLIEASVSLAVLGLLLTSVFSIVVETSNFLRDNEVDTVLQTEGTRMLERVTEVLRKTGRTELGGVRYPSVRDGGSRLEFLVLDDADGNGHAFDGTTSLLEWRPTVYSIARDADGQVQVVAGGIPVCFLGRFVNSLSFQTVDENPGLHLKEISVSFEVERKVKSGYSLAYGLSGSIHMRN